MFLCTLHPELIDWMLRYDVCSCDDPCHTIWFQGNYSFPKLLCAPCLHAPLPACNRAYIPPHREHTAWSCHGNASSWLKNMLLSLGGGGGEHWRLVKNEHTEHNRLTREPVNRYWHC